MGQVLPVFAHCKEAPSTASSTPDSTEGGNDDSDFRELHTAREFSEDDEEETTSQDWGTPRELTFSYIAFDGIVGSGGRRDSVARRPRPQGRSVSEPRDPPPQPGLGDSLESIPSLSQSPEPGRRGDPDTLPLAEHPLEDQLGWAARSAGSGEDSATSSSTPLENEEPDELEAIEPKEEANLELRLAQALRSQLEVLTPQPSPSSRTPQAHTPSPSRSQDSNSGPDEPLLNEEEEHWRLLEQEPITAQCLDSTDQSEFILKPLLLGAGTFPSPSLGVLAPALSLSLDVPAQLRRPPPPSEPKLSPASGDPAPPPPPGLALLFYILTFVGAIFNGLTLVILGVVALFTIPLLYRQHQAQIDQYVGLVTNQLSHIKAKIRAKIPGTGTPAASAVSGSKAKAE
ncbi:reticulon-2 [Alexandromys fortis]|uniref:reticulon-2 n=1 Tax=Alexandromys fortis TaxID=100897 RepID=UPI0021533D81|nr:reticulon-2 [Microtus fortis]